MTFNAPYTTSAPLFKQLKILPINDTLYLTNITLIYRALKSEIPLVTSNALDLKYVPGQIVTRGNSVKLLRRHRVRTTNYGLLSIKYKSILDWNSLQKFSKVNLTDLSNSKIKSITLEFLSLQK